ncbi:MAG: tryptophan synthase subunit alpha [Planctomycetes bacterium]|nr:tryptophan synthase subunit alpha [Planctomycetota bacterium]
MTLRETFETLRGRDELAFMPYQTAGFPTLEKSVENLRVLGEHGADLLELGIPFSDPIADGPTIQYSSHAALANGVRLRDVLATLRNVELPCPLVMMSYLNPLMAYGRERLFADMRTARISGLIVPDLSLEEAGEWLAAAREHGISIVFLLAPTSTDERIRRTAELTDDFIYAVSLTGTTGARDALYTGLPVFLKRIKAVTDKPIVVGFGISTPEHVRALRGHADGVVVASRIIDAIRRGDEWTGLVESLKAATR